MRILYFYQYFTTPKGSWSTRVYEFSKRWVEQGHSVTVVTSVYAKSDIQARGLLSSQMFDGVNVKIINAHIDNKQRTLRRAIAFFKYTALSCWYALWFPCDVVVASSGPLNVAIPGLLAHSLRRKRMIFEVRDIWPQNLVELGLLHNRWLTKFLFCLERKSYHYAFHIITLSPDMEKNIRERFGYDKVTTVTNQANTELFGLPAKNPIPEFLRGRKYAICVGNIGEKDNSFLLYEAAKRLDALGSDVLIVMIGDGPLKAELSERACIEGVTNFRVLDIMPKIDLVSYLQHAMVAIVPFSHGNVLSMSSPNKFFESLAAGIPIIQTTDGWMSNYVRENEVGFTTSPTNPDELAHFVMHLSQNSLLVMQMGANAKRVAKRDFDKNILADKMARACFQYN